MAGIGLATIATIGGLGAQAYSFVRQRKEQKRAAALNEEARKKAQQQQDISARRERRAALRERQVRRSQSIATAQAAGGLNSSGLAGGLGSLSSQTGEALGFSTQLGGLSRDISNLGSQANKALARADTAGQIGQFGSALFSFGARRGGLDFLKNTKLGNTLGVVSPPTKPTPPTDLTGGFGQPNFKNPWYKDPY